MVQPKEYYAFISYKREDEKWAKWLQNKLEHYRFPTNLNGRTDLPKDIRPTIRDVTDFKPGLLAEEINNALSNSEWLIVVCSPRSAKSPWVCKEAQTFIDLDRADHIIPFVIEGYPFSNDTATECYPEALLNLTGSKELLAANINEMGRDAAAIKVVSRMFNLHFDDLWKRFEREQKSKRRMTFCVLSSFLVIAIIIAAYIWHQNYRLKESISRLMSKTAISLVDKGDSYTARIISLKALDMAYTAEAEASLRKACEYDNAIIYNTSDRVKRICLRADGQQFLSVSRDSTIQIWDFYSGACINKTKWDDYIEAACYSPNGKKVALTSGKKISILNPTTNTIRLITEQPGCINSIHFSPDNKRLAVAYDDSIQIWDTETGLLSHHQHSEHYSTITSVCFSPDSNRIAFSIINRSKIYPDNIILYNIGIWDLTKDSCWIIPGGHDDRINDVSFSPDGKQIVSASYDGSLQLRNTSTGDSIWTIRRNATFTTAQFSNDGNLIVSTSRDRILRIWNSIDGNCVDSLYQSPESSNTAYFTPDNKHVVFDNCWNIRIWNFSAKETYRQISKSRNENPMSISPDGKYLVTSAPNGIINIRDLLTGSLKKTFDSNHDNLSIKFSPDGNRLVSGTQDSIIYIYNSQTGQQIGKSLKGHTDKVLSASFSPDGKYIISASADSTVRLWNSETGEFVKILHKHASQVNSAIFSPDGKYIISESNDSIHIFNYHHGDCLKTMPNHIGYKFVLFKKNKKHDPFQISFSSSHDLRSIWDENVRVTGYINWGITLNGHTNAVRSVALSNDSKYIASSSKDGTIRIWDSKKGLCYCTWNGDAFGSPIVLFSPNGNNIVSSLDGLITIWDFPPIQELMEQTRKRFKNRQLTIEERRRCDLE